MKVLTDGYTHHAKLEICGAPDDAGNGIQINPALAGANPTVKALGDDSNVTLEMVAQTAAVAQQRAIYNGAPKTIVDGSATSLFDVACTAGTMSGGAIHFLVRAFDGTDLQVISGIATYGMVNKAGVNTLTITYVAANEAKAVSAGTLTLAFTFVTGTSKGTVKVQPTGSLTETAPYTIEYTVFPIRGAVTIL